MKLPFRGEKLLLEKREFPTQHLPVFLRLAIKLSIGLFLLISLASLSFASAIILPGIPKKQLQTNPQADQAVLGTATQKVLGKISFNIPAYFTDTATFQQGAVFNGKAVFNNDIQITNHDLDLGTGRLIAANVVYGVTAGPGITVSGGQNPTVSNTGVLSVQGQTGAVAFTPGTGITFNGLKINNSGVTSVQGQSGAVTLTAGSGISIDGTTISNTSQGTNAFGTVASSGTTFSAGSSNDTLTVTAGNGVRVTPNAANKSITITNTFAPAGLTTNGVLYVNSASSFVSLAPGTSGYVLQSNGAGSPPSWVVNTSTSPSFAVISTGTNTTAAMTVDTGASLTFNGSGTINASTLLGSTWAAAGAIGSTTPNSGAFTTLTGTTVNGLTITNNGTNTLNIAAGKSFIVNNTLTISGSDATSFTLPSASDTLVGRTSTDTLTNKTIAAGSNTISGLTNANLSGTAGITNANLANSSVTVTAGIGLSGGGAVSLGSSVTINNAGVLSLTSTQATVSASTGNITISLPQNIDTDSSPYFKNLTLSGLGAGVVHSNTSGLLSSSAVGLAGSDVTGTLGVGNGGTGIASYTIGDLLYASNTTTLSRLTDVAIGSCLISGGVGVAPSWGSCTSTVQYWQQNTDAGSGLNVLAPATIANTLAIGITNPLDFSGFEVDQNSKGNAVAVINQTGSGNIFTASASGTPKFTIDNTGNVMANGNIALAASAISASNYITAPNFVVNTSGQITTGTWQATAIGAQYGGTGLDTHLSTGVPSISSGTWSVNAQLPLNLGGTGANLTADNGGIVYSNSSTLQILAHNANSGLALVSGGNGTPTWFAPTQGSVIFAGVNGALSQNNPNFFWDNANNRFGVGVNSGLLGTLDVRTTSGTLPVATISGNTSFASLVVDNSGSGPIFAASSSGVSQFTIANNGTLTDVAYGTGIAHINSTGTFSSSAVNLNSSDVTATLPIGSGGTGQSSYTAGDMLYYASGTSLSKLAIGNNNTCLISNGSAPTWGSCALGSNYWQLNSNLLSPSNSTYDFAIGGTATSSALFQVFANTGNATTAGTLTFTGTGSQIQTVKNQTLTLGGNSTGDIQFKPGNSSSGLYLASNGNVGIGTTNPGVNLEIAKARTGNDTLLTLETTGNGATNDQANILFKLPGAVGTLRSVAEISAIDQNVNNVVPGILTFSTSTGTSNLTERLRIDNAGNIGINTTIPTSILDVRGTNGINTMSGTIPVADFIGSTSFAGVVVDNAGTGALFSASSSGIPQFTIANNGILTDVAYGTGIAHINSSGVFSSSAISLNSADVANTLGVGNGGTGVASIGTGTLLYGSGTTSPMTALAIGSNNQCLLSNGTNPVWGSCALGSNLWQLNTGALSPVNNTNDLLLGGTSTSSAAFGFINIASGTPTATISSNLSLKVPTGANPASNLNLLNGGTFAINTSAGGDAGLSANPAFYISSGGLVGIGTSAPTAALTVAGTILPTNTQAFNLGQNGAQWNQVFGSALYAIKAGAQIPVAGVGIQVDKDTLGNSTVIINQRSNVGDLFVASTSGSTKFIIKNSGSVGIGTTSPLAQTGLDIEKNSLGNAALIVANTGGAGDVFTASSGATPEFVINSSGNVGVGTTNPSLFTLQVAGNVGPNANTTYDLGASGTAWRNLYVGNVISSAQSGQNGFWQLNSGALSPTNITNDLLIGGTATGSATPFQVYATAFNNGKSIPAGTASTSGQLTFTAATQLNLLNNASLGIYTSVGGDTGLNANPALFIGSNSNVSLGTTSTINGLGLGAVGANTAPKFFLAAQSGSSVADANYVGRWQSNSPSNFWGIGEATLNNDNILRIGNVTSSSSNAWNATQNLNLVIGGSLGIGQGSNTTLLGALDARAVSGTLPIASLSGATSFAGLVVDNSGAGDLFTASSSGLSRFVITQAGNVGIGTTTPQAALDIGPGGPQNNPKMLGLEDYANNSNGMAQLFGNWNASGYWGLGTVDNTNGDQMMRIGLTSQTGTWQSNQTLSLLIDGAPGTKPLAASGLDVERNSLGNSSLVVNNVGGSGDIFTASSAGSPKFVINSAGNVGIGTTNPSNLLQVAGTIGLQNSQTLTGVTNFTQFSNGISVGGGTTFNITNAGVGTFASGTSLTSNGPTYFQVGSTAGNGSFGRMYADLVRAGDFALTDGNANSYLYAYAGAALTGVPIGSIGIGTNVTSPHATLDVEGGNTGGNAAFLVNQTGVNTNDIFTASAAGVTKFTIGNNGNITDTAASTVNFSGAALTVASCTGCGGSGTWSTFTNNTNTIIDPNPLTDALSIGNAGTGNYLPFTSLYVEPAFNSKGNALAAFNQTGGGDILTASLSGTPKFVINKSGQVGIGTGSPGSDIDLESTDTSGTIFNIANSTNLASATVGEAITINGGGSANVTGLQITIGNGTGNNLNALVVNNNVRNTVLLNKSGTLTLGAAGFNNGTLTLASGALSFSSTIQAAQSGQIANLTFTLPSTAGNNGQYLSTDGSGNMSWVSGLWQLNSGVLSPTTISNQVAIGQTTALASTGLDVEVNSKGNAAAVINNSGGAGDLLTASSAGATKFVINSSGNVGIGTSTPSQSLDVEGGNILIGQQINTSASADSTWNQISGTAGTIGGGVTSLIASASAMAVYNGSLYVGTHKTSSAEVYRYNGTNGSWTRVSFVAGVIVNGGTANIDEVSSMAVYNGNLYIGTSKSGGAEVYQYSGGTTWTKVSQTLAGTIANGGTNGINGVTAMTVYDGRLYIGTNKSTKAQIYRYEGGTTWTVLTGTAGNVCVTGSSTAGTAMDMVSAMTAYNSQMWIATAKGDTNAQMCSYAFTSSFLAINAAGTITDQAVGTTISGISQITSMITYNGHLYLGYRKSGGNGGAFMYEDTSNGGINDAPSNNFSLITNSQGTIDGSTTGIQSVSALAIYNGKLYVGTEKTNGAELYRYEGGFATASTWTKLTGTAGVIGNGATNIDMISEMIPYNGSLFAGTYEPNKAEVYQNTVINNQSYALEFHAGTTQGGGEQNNLLNMGTISFIASASAQDTGYSSNGAFVFDHSITTATGAYDYAEDYGTRDNTLGAGDIVALDPNENQMVVKANNTTNTSMIGIYSTNPGFELSQKDTTINGGRAIPVALTGRVPVKVSNENGAIHNGDLLTISAIPGTAAKATKPGFMVGRAMEAFDGTNGTACADSQQKTRLSADSLTDSTTDVNASGLSHISLPQNSAVPQQVLCGTVMAFVNVTWADPGVQLTQNGDLNIADSLPTLFAPAPPIGDQAVLAASATSLNNPSATPSGAMSDALSQLGNEVSLLQTQYASLSAQMTKVSAIDDLSKRVEAVETLSALSASESARGTRGTFDTRDTLTDDSGNATISGQLSVLGKTLLSDVGITGKISMGLLSIDGMGSDPINPAAEINTLAGPLRIQPLGLGGVDFLNGKVLIDTLGNMTINAAVTAKKYNVDTTDTQAASIGEATLPAGTTSIIIQTTAVTADSKIFVTAENLITQPLTVTKKVPGKSFTVEINQAQWNNVKFNWWIVN